MSDDAATVDEQPISSDDVLDRIESWYQVPALLALGIFMLWVRVRSRQRFVRNGEVFFSGNDAWYHYRQVKYTVANWPQTMPFDPWTYFPYGTSSGQFGTLFDQLIATAALIVGLGDPSAETVAKTVLYAPPVFGTLVLIPTYLLGKRLGNRLTGIFAGLVLSLLPGLFLYRGLVGAADHNIAEPVFQGMAVLAMLVALGVVQQEKPVWEQVVERDVIGLRRSVGWSALAGVATGLYLWLWPPGILLIGVFGIFFLLVLTSNYVRGESPDHIGLVATVSMSVTGIMALFAIKVIDFSAAQPSLIQPVGAFGVAGTAAALAGLARSWDDRSIPVSAYPVAVFGAVGLGTLLTWLLFPDLFGFVKSNLFRFIGFDAAAQTRTISEAQPFVGEEETLFETVTDSYGFAFFTALAGALTLLWKGLVDRERNPEHLLILVWFAFITAAAFTQVRFNYYLAVPVAVLNGVLLGFVLEVVIFDDLDPDSRTAIGYQVAALLLVAMVVTVPLVGGIGERKQGAAGVGNSTGPGSGIVGWDGSLDWLSENTPAEGNFGGAGNADQLDFYGTYSQTDDLDYPAGSYGVMSWWDYGHWITSQGERIPNANPFQQGATTAANYLLAPNETRANTILDQMDEDDAKTRYVMVDWKMATPGSKFGAPTVFYDDGPESGTDFREPIFRTNDKGQVTGNQYLLKQRYYQSQMIQLYRNHGSRVEASPIVTDWRTSTVDGRTYRFAPTEGNITKRFDTMADANAYVRNDSSSQIGGSGNNPAEDIPALQHYRLVKASDRPAPLGLVFRGRLPASATWVKTFERVPGATIQGQGPADATVTASVDVSGLPSLFGSGSSTFTYTQEAQTDSNGEFTMTLPYSTTGYDNWGPENGHTNVSARATGPYTFSSQTTTADDPSTTVRWNATAQVSEGNVIGEDDSPVTVELTRAVDEDSDSDNESETNSSNDSQNTEALEPPAGPAADMTEPTPRTGAQDRSPVSHPPALGEPRYARVR